ncbi:zinc finger C2HC domain-containing protein 1B-like [Haliotis rubra]|uniref:zinc finger C2HC domain-containing protein 1B-like n=1 Tax=Haliotis rubra TaxID=36100 RepID=UPI001EE4F376|nr:zinc finger C2HC domain-containing protein 1B-like [Haliotis rubra]
MASQYQEIDRCPCRHCGRQFVPESLAVHERICAKSAQKKRKVFDSTKQRVQGTELNLRQVKQAQKKDVPPSRSNWRAQHEDFMNTVKAARGVTVAMKEGRPLPPPPPPSINPDYVQCPHCQRRFNTKAAERHIPFCKEKSQRINRAQPSAAAKAKQAARLQYQAPRPKVKGSPGGLSSGVAPSSHAPGGQSMVLSSAAAKPGNRGLGRSVASKGRSSKGGW